ncbi:MAG: hypothetical protein WAO21_05665 [Verrucomicrobiia bacterium]
MTKQHNMALTIASCHFVFCVFLSFIALFLSFGYGLSDQAVTPAWWFVVMNKVLLFFEAPVVAILRLLYHPIAHFEPPSLFAIDFAKCSNIYVVVVLCLLWSIGFGYLIAYAIRRLKTKKPD